MSEESRQDVQSSEGSTSPEVAVGRPADPNEASKQAEERYHRATAEDPSEAEIEEAVRSVEREATEAERKAADEALEGDPLADYEFADEKPFASGLSGIEEQEGVEETGRWFNFNLIPGCQVKIAHFSALIEKNQRLVSRWQRSNRNKTPPTHIAERLYQKAMFGTVVLDWRGMMDDGTELEFSEKNFDRAIKLRRFRGFVLSIARSQESFREEAVETAAGN